MKKPNAIDASIDFIESRLTETICVSELAQQAFFSKTHYQRLFRAIVGEPVMEYVKNRRLQLACRDILGSSSILDVALKYGYDSHEGFTRAFKAYFSVTPSEYRKHVKLNETEAVKMLSKEVLNRIGQNAEKISAVLYIFCEEADKLTTDAFKSIEAAGIKGTTTAIVARELRNLSVRVGNFKDEIVKSLAVCDTPAFEMFGKIYNLIRCIDDMVFQMNLLRVFSGIETGRIYPPKDEFEAIDAGYARLCSQIVGNKDQMIALINEAVDLLHEDIKQEAANCIADSVKALNQAAVEGENTEASARSAAESLGERGKAFSYIAKEVTSSICVLKSLTDDLVNTRSLSVSLALLSVPAFGMNINAFNAAVESARAGNSAECSTASEKIMIYAGVLQKTYRECETLCAEYERLTELTKRNGKQCEQTLNQKRLDDIIFQSGILSSQFALESERFNNDTFRTIAQIAVTAHAQLVETRDVAKCRESIAKFLQELNNSVAKLEYGGSFAYFAKEYEYFLNRISFG